jgi:formylglycine-generating enzyme required for sulfatase activity
VREEIKRLNLEEAERQKPEKINLASYTNSIGMEFVLIPAGSFMEECYSAKRLRHRVTISKPFYLGKFEVTQAQWEAVMGNNPSKFKGPDNPVELVSWSDAQDFIRRLNAKEGHRRYRLPKEAEWEYAARAGTDGAWFFGDEEAELSEYAWHEDNSEGTPHPVGQKLANPWGLHDVYGNVWEWIHDWYDWDYYAKSPGIDPKGPAEGTSRVLRGFGWHSLAKGCHSGFRYGLPSDLRFDYMGFRLALSPE